MGRRSIYRPRAIDLVAIARSAWTAIGACQVLPARL